MTQIPLAYRRLMGVLILVLILASLAGYALMQSTSGGALPEAPADASEAQLPLPSAEELAQAYGGVSKNSQQQALVSRVGAAIASKSDAAKTGTTFRFYLLADENRINAFALPDGTVFITTLLLNHLKTEGQLAAVLAHEVAQVAARHRPAYDAAGYVTFTPEREAKADQLGVKFAAQTGYDPRALVDVLVMLRDINNTTPVEFYRTHPSPVNRVHHIDYAISRLYPDGVPTVLSK